MLRLTELAHRICGQVLEEGDCVIDATVGNGHDTRFLANAVGSSGRVYGFDIQPEAIDLTRRTLASIEDNRVTLITGSHADMGDRIPAEHHGRIKLIMFNLGYLPGGDKEITTQTESTRLALEASCRLLAHDGLISIIAYPGHAGGAEETAAVETFLQQKEVEGWHVERFPKVKETDTAPRLFFLSPQSLIPDP